MSTPGRFALLPHVQTLLAAQADRHAESSRLRLTYALRILADGAPSGHDVAVAAELRGPGDVAALQRAQISRIEPAPGLRGFEPNYFPFVEFMDADLPWRYSLDAGPAKRKKPWIVLVVLKAGEFEFLPQGSCPLPTIKVFDSGRSLPDLSQSWAWAHTQVNLPDTGAADPAAALAANVASGFSRLLCPRRLEERQSYSMFLVPAYRAGAEAGRGEKPAADASDLPAWTGGGKDVLLPIYFETRFSTDSVEDLEELLRRLRGLPAAERAAASGARPVSAARPGYYPGYSKPGATFDMETALVAPDRGKSVFSTDEELAQRLSDTLRTVIQGEADDPEGEDPLVAFPPYGFRFRRETEALPSRAKSGQWFDRVNLDLKMRQVAALGARTVVQNQELFARLCWDQYAELREANLKLARLRAAEELVKRGAGRRLDRLAPATALLLSQPLQAVVLESDGGPAIEEALRGRGVPTSYLARTLRRQAAKRPVRDPAAATTTATATAATKRGKTIPTPFIPGDVSVLAAAVPGRAAPRARLVDLVAAARTQMGFQEIGLGGLMAVRMPEVIGVDRFAEQARPRSLGIAVKAFDAAPLARRITDAVRQLPALKAQAIVEGRLPAELDSIEPVYRSPVVPLPLSEFLEGVAPDAFIGDISALPINTVSLFEENRAFVEAFLVGANHAMNDELRWREFPTDMRGTIFRRFWNRARAFADPAGDDIRAIHGWTGSLGTHPGPGDADAKTNLVIVIKGEIVRKLVDPIVVINEAPPGSVRWESGKGRDLSCVFAGKLGKDTLYLGYDIALADLARERTYMVFYEPMGSLRFGLDVATQSVREERAQFERQSLAFPVATLGRSYRDVASRPARMRKPPPALAAKWDDLSWSHMRIDQAGYIDFGRTITVTAAGEKDLWGPAKTSASLARSFWQKPLAGVLPFARVL